MRIFVVLVMAIFAFAATIVGALYFAGGFTQEGMQKLLGIEPPKAQQAAPPSAEQIPEVVKALNERDAELTERETALKTEEKRIEQTRQQLDELRTARRSTNRQADPGAALRARSGDAAAGGKKGRGDSRRHEGSRGAPRIRCEEVAPRPHSRRSTRTHFP